MWSCACSSSPASVQIAQHRRQLFLAAPMPVMAVKRNPMNYDSSRCKRFLSCLEQPAVCGERQTERKRGRERERSPYFVSFEMLMVNVFSFLLTHFIFSLLFFFFFGLLYKSTILYHLSKDEINNTVQKKVEKHNDKITLYCFLKFFYEEKIFFWIYLIRKIRIHSHKIV